MNKIPEAELVDYMNIYVQISLSETKEKSPGNAILVLLNILSSLSWGIHHISVWTQACRLNNLVSLVFQIWKNEKHRFKPTNLTTYNLRNWNASSFTYYKNSNSMRGDPYAILHKEVSFM